MSVTFDVQSASTLTAPACPKCGAQSGVRHGTVACDYQAADDQYPCDGYGPTPPQTGMNVANGNAAAILFDLLGYGREEVDCYGGTLDPSDVLRRLATAEGRAAGLVRAPSESRGVYLDANGVGAGALMVDCGRSASQVDRYIERLREMATRAVAEGRAITYG